jgi:uncharacterized tellurite resistance protein B-like protein
MNNKRFYSELGKLLYAVADVDGKISRQEKAAIHKMIQERLVCKETQCDEFNTNLAHYVEFEFEVAEEQGMTVKEAFTSFMNYIDANSRRIDNNLKETCLLIAEKIAQAYHGSNKKEQHMISILKKKLMESGATVNGYHA